MLSDTPALPPVDPAGAHAALTAVVPRLTALIRSVRHPDRHAVGDWNVGDVAVHLADAWAVLPTLSREGMASPIREVGELAALTAALVRQQPDRDLASLAGRIDAAAADFLAATDGRVDGTTAPWLVDGIRVPVSTFLCHLLSESLVHGDDIARAEGLPWTIERRHATLALMGFVMPMAQSLEPHALVHQDRAAGVHARYDIRFRGDGGVHITIDDGTMRIAPRTSARVDCHMSANPAALLLQIFGRRSQWHALARGQITSWGRRPWLGLALRPMLNNP